MPSALVLIANGSEEMELSVDCGESGQRYVG